MNVSRNNFKFTTTTGFVNTTKPQVQSQAGREYLDQRPQMPTKQQRKSQLSATRHLISTAKTHGVPAAYFSDQVHTSTETWTH
ncbi:hypothetical protein PsorP6_001682 [Peronosclerospora sorghi]|uniref:Uncharacterized protein n=1 Tax=Peronosclerospora sorghi TaxID=230839 RepID=A0ACC0WW17_9STRA|nr:hypothetical protein PsorP6_001682 [Peronosclerospora sorghi]